MRQSSCGLGEVGRDSLYRTKDCVVHHARPQLLRDHSDGTGDVAATYKKQRDHRWFDSLPHEDQALFVPIDTYVRDSAVANGASATARKYDVQSIQTDAVMHRAVSTEIVRWARTHRFDPRDLDVYWYSVGADNIHEDGSPATCLKWSTE